MIFMFTDPTPLPVVLIASLLRDVIARLRGVLGFGNPVHRRAAMLGPFHAYAWRVWRRFERLVARHEAGVMRPAVVRVRAARTDSGRDRARVRLPMQRAWVIDAVGYRAAGVASQLEYLLARPDMAGIIALYPQAARMLRPMCHMLGIAPVSVPKLAKWVERRVRVRPQAAPLTPHPGGEGVGRVRLTRREREDILWYPNSEGQPMKLLPKKLPRD